MRKWTRPAKPDHDAATFDVLHALRGRTAAEIAARTWVSASTIRKWRRGYERGGARYPQHATLAAVAAVAGLRFALVPMAKESAASRQPVHSGRTRRPAEVAIHAD